MSPANSVRQAQRRGQRHAVEEDRVRPQRQATRGIIRVHQFNKIEMFVYCDPAEAEAEHERLLTMERAMLAKVGLPYRIIDTAAGDLGQRAARKFDCEAWVPSQGAYREVTSTSNCTTFQARRLRTRFKGATGRSDHWQ